MNLIKSLDLIIIISSKTLTVCEDLINRHFSPLIPSLHPFPLHNKQKSKLVVPRIEFLLSDSFLLSHLAALEVHTINPIRFIDRRNEPNLGIQQIIINAHEHEHLWCKH